MKINIDLTPVELLPDIENELFKQGIPTKALVTYYRVVIRLPKPETAFVEPTLATNIAVIAVKSPEGLGIGFQVKILGLSPEYSGTAAVEILAALVQAVTPLLLNTTGMIREGVDFTSKLVLKDAEKVFNQLNGEAKPSRKPTDPSNN